MSAVLKPAPYQPASLPARTIAVAEGDGIGPEIMQATLAVLSAADPALSFQQSTVGLKAYESGELSGVGAETWEAIDAHGVLLKGPITTPQGGGYKSVNVTLRKTLGLFANLRPCIAYDPFVPGLHPGMDLVIVRENEEDTYAGIEHRQTDEVVQCLKLISRPGCERIVRYAFEYAVAHGRKKVTCMSKDNIMKLTDGLFHKVFDEIAAEYPQIISEHRIIDIGTARIAARPKDFDVVVTPNLYGDILSDVAAEVAGSIGLAGSSNVGPTCAMFEAVHGSAPDIAGQDIANPSGLLLSAVMMLVHLGRARPATDIHNAWLCALEDGLHTADIFREGRSAQRLGTRAFAQAVIERLGQRPRKLAPVDYPEQPAAQLKLVSGKDSLPRATKTLDGVDAFLHWNEAGRDPQVLGQALGSLAGPEFNLRLITNRGVKVFPHGHPGTFCTDHWRCRFLLADAADRRAIPALLLRLAEAGFDAIKTENLYRFDGERGYSLAQGE
ncbi:NADP-dependent isocitrate dehydrogenase [Pseudomarimonas salicorniae]|uniref:Isocitrate dehydrogenase [NADP] n=1 Tax=Pseudomarimonas salicorniae TaxID=2933270 RepID=A0ABT0GH73_9GAMM|nr:NADP-dependent isocitrate dehydrogenase [Lysobacter sp. CAU 1642]MCK7593412.1 NADP-dependent isocitrate dehydrogenase [Lysobacter sp. CAU 1642]